MHKRTTLVLLLAAVTATVVFADEPSSRAVPDPALLQTRLDDALAAAAWDSALVPAQQLAWLAQEHYLTALYQVLRIECQQQNHAQAYLTLATLLDGGWSDYAGLRQDPDLALINRDDKFLATIRASWSRQYIRMLERESRDAMQKPDEIMRTLAVHPGERVADVGAGSGYFTVRLADAVGAAGHVWALDIRQEMLDYIAGRLREPNITNVELKLVQPDDPLLPAGGVDTILMVDTMHYVKDREAYARKLRAALAPGGRVVVIDFRYDPQAQHEFAPPPEQQVPQETLDREMAAAGLKVAAAYDFLPEQYFIVYAAQ